jgi:hypothetical protein
MGRELQISWAVLWMGRVIRCRSLTRMVLRLISESPHVVSYNVRRRALTCWRELSRSFPFSIFDFWFLIELTEPAEAGTLAPELQTDFEDEDEDDSMWATGWTVVGR